MSRQTQRALVMHAPDGGRFIVECEADWDAEGNCIGGHISLAAGPIDPGDLQPEGGPLEATPEVFDRIDRWPGLTDENAAWLREEEDTGRLIYPIGAR